MHLLARLARSCSQMRRTRQPNLRSSRLTRRSRSRLADNFFSQNARLPAGILKCRGQPCQKQPSTNTASHFSLKAKSGLPKTFRCLRQPVILCVRNNFASASSVSLLPRDRMRDITSERFALVKTSDMKSANDEIFVEAKKLFRCGRGDRCGRWRRRQ